jgi:hypothetical protein
VLAQWLLRWRNNGLTDQEHSYRLAFDKGVADDTKPEWLLTAYLEQGK